MDAVRRQRAVDDVRVLFFRARVRPVDERRVRANVPSGVLRDRFDVRRHLHGKHVFQR